MMNNDPSGERPNGGEEEEGSPTPNLYEGSQGAVRFPAWVALAVLSVLSWIAMLSRRHLSAAAYKWAITVGTLSSVFGVLSVVGYVFYRGIYTGQPPELAVVSRMKKIMWDSFGSLHAKHLHNGMLYRYRCCCCRHYYYYYSK
jgi:hypothetical protein